MQIKELKELVENNKYKGEELIFNLAGESSRLIVNQYIHKIALDNNLTIKYISSEDEIQTTDEFSLFDDLNKYLYIMVVDELTNIKYYNNLIYICNKTKQPTAIKIPTLLDWQVEDYIMQQASGLDINDAKQLVSVYKDNYTKLFSDLTMLCTFEPAIQKNILMQLTADNYFDDIYTVNIFDLSNAIIKKDKNKVERYLNYIDNSDITPLGLHKILYNDFSYILAIQTSKNCTAAMLGLKDKQFTAIKYNCNHYTNEQLVRILLMLTNIEYKFKYCGVSMDDLVKYMIYKILGE